MPRQDLLINLEDALRLGVESSSAELVRRARMGAMRLIAHSVLSRSGDDLRRLETDLGDAHTNLVLKHDWKPEADLKAEAWMLAAASALAGMVAAMLPRKIVLDADLGTRRGEVLMALKKTNQEALSNTDLAEKVGARPETITRVLDSARQDGLVESWRRSRNSMNRLTDAGRVHAAALVEAQINQEDEAMAAFAQNRFRNAA
ncbi:MAG: hypothetical protein IPL62_06445 [Caulobacteraceae bacterium]|nr:hypothetical protein [Caulobacteraceae bacterium]